VFAADRAQIGRGSVASMTEWSGTEQKNTPDDESRYSIPNHGAPAGWHRGRRIRFSLQEAAATNVEPNIEPATFLSKKTITSRHKVKP
jgi:hypothetical protein